MKTPFVLGLKEICDIESQCGNEVAAIIDHSPLPKVVVFKDPIHRAAVESARHSGSGIRWFSVGGFAGYVIEATGESVQGPAADPSISAPVLRDRVDAKLRSIYDIELSCGNSVVRVDEPAGDRCPLAIVFKQPLHKGRIESLLVLPSAVKWWESRDPHYEIQGGYICEGSRHVIAGPLAS